MTIVQPSSGGPGGRPAPSGGGLADVIDTILDKGLVIDAYVSVALVGIELLTINARVVVASVDTYLRFAQAVNRLDLSEGQKGLPELMQDMTQGVAKSKTKGIAQGALEAAGERLRDFIAEPAERPASRGRRREED
ncbi:putative gas vesicle structural protein 1 [Sphaerisporangium melleum]|uniref:Gas vesicle protein A n=1 Tax=Sphaerisporangium melleum TaxID=321316 RepID=A0A917RNK8_9ACTN|nr:gas vesicle protein GvpJ [Sphaerisporangium melleum]GGL16256.1 putative gas vesicle structural protein 1 [Sphaerisporangium melleum]GII70577.1 putative gas vesicle structural protein 1 [Sphaerisporangium melleum]